MKKKNRWKPLANACAVFSVVASAIGVSAHAGGDNGGGNGGDTVNCRPSGLNSFKGYYALDYMATYTGGSELASVNSWEESRDRILKLLQEKVPALAASFEEYQKLVDNHDDYSQPRIWEKASFGLVRLTDPVSSKKLPENCVRRASGVDRVIRAVWRVRHSGMLVYQYDPTILEMLRAKRPLQYSFIMVHEWLWDLTGNLSVVQMINHLLHSESTAALTPGKLTSALANLGVILGPMPLTGVYYPQQENQFEDSGILGGRYCGLKVESIAGSPVRFSVKTIRDPRWSDEPSRGCGLSLGDFVCDEFRVFGLSKSLRTVCSTKDGVKMVINPSHDLSTHGSCWTHDIPSDKSASNWCTE